MPIACTGLEDDDEVFDLIRSEEHTSELQSRSDLVCRLLLEKKKQDVGHEITLDPNNVHQHPVRDHIKLRQMSDDVPVPRVQVLRRVSDRWVCHSISGVQCAD